ncbi:MAG TPA: hypothetical protein PK747_00885 [Acidobacteriota bacterium]|nr:hypothetical protein [Acidobacteriota bacterium]HNT16571.1 hypothetical protein [Acidobacteriota bacterium]HQO19054.1 hypothetical protein [Acidobacteriota bacterium]HQQ45947.1 hypothetical protein [Acidobacteriota bacterium]
MCDIIVYGEKRAQDMCNTVLTKRLNEQILVDLEFVMTSGD